MHFSRAVTLICLLLMPPFSGFSQTKSSVALQRAIEEIQRESGAKIGVAADRFSGGPADSFCYNSGIAFPMQSVYKLPLALAVLDEVSNGKLSLAQQVAIRQKELDPGTWSPMAKLHPAGDFMHTVAELLRFTVSQSDNNACDILFRLIGGPKSAQRYLEAKKLREIKIISTEKEMHRDGTLQYRNSSTPAAMLGLLRRIHSGDLLHGEPAAFLDLALTKSENSPNRIGGRLPKKNYVLAHKTGTSGTNEQGFTAAVNDVGILTLGDTNLGIVVFVSDYRGDVAEGEAYIATISRLLWDYYMPE